MMSFAFGLCFIIEVVNYLIDTVVLSIKILSRSENADVWK